MTTSNRQAITELAETQNNRSVTVNEAIAILESGASRFCANSVGDTAPPGSAVEGDMYVLGGSPTGAWAGKGNYIALYYNASWLFIPPLEGYEAYAQDDGSEYLYDTSVSPPTWSSAVGGGGGVASTRQIISGGGLTGGGDLSADRTLVVGAGTGITVNADDVAVNINGLSADATPDGTADYVMTYDASATTLKKVLLNNLPSGSGAVTTARQIISGAGLTGGGDLSADRTLVVGAGTGITVNADDVALNVSGLTEDTSPDESADFLLTYDTSAATHKKVKPDNVRLKECIIIAVSDETTALTTGAPKVTFRMPYAFTLSEVRGSLTTAQTSGSIFTVDVNETNTTIISTKLTIDNTEKTSTTAATPAVISDAALADDAEITIDIDQVGDGTAKGLKVTLIGVRA